MIPDGLLDTIPRPVPARVTVNMKVSPPPTPPKVAVTILAASIVTVQVPDPVHAPDQPPKAVPPPALAVRVTTVPAAYSSVQSLPQRIPAGFELTTLVPEMLTVSRLLAPFRAGGEEPMETSRRHFGDEFNALANFFARKRLFLPKATASDVERLINRIADTVVEFDRGREDERLGLESELRGWAELWKEIKTEIPSVRETLEDDFRSILGMS